MNGHVKPSAPEYFVLPIEDVKKVLRKGPWSKVVFAEVDLEKYRNNWSLITKRLLSTR